MFNNPNQEELTQHEKILVIMFKNKEANQISWWRASYFQQEQNGIFVGYEATARMSELVKKYPFAFDLRMSGRFREIRFKFENAREIYNQLPVELGRHLVREKVII